METEWIILLAVVVVLVAVGVFLYMRNRQPVEEEMLHFNCPGCKRKLRYKPKQAGHQGACPRCRETFLFPLAGKSSSSR